MVKRVAMDQMGPPFAQGPRFAFEDAAFLWSVVRAAADGFVVREEGPWFVEVAQAGGMEFEAEVDVVKSHRECGLVKTADGFKGGFA